MMITQILKEKSPRFTIRFPVENKDLDEGRLHDYGAYYELLVEV